jgi:predicted metalloprotease with PDZ domain
MRSLSTPNNPTRYRITPLDPRAHLFEVACTVDDPDPAGQAFRLPTWVPGSYLIREFARHFVAVRAEGPQGAVDIAKESKDTWRAAPCGGPLTVIAQVYAYDLSVRTAYLDARRGYFNGASVFLLPEGRSASACQVNIEPPPHTAFAHWRVATTLGSRGAVPYGFGRYEAENYDALIDHPVEMSDFALVQFEAGNVPHDVAVSGRQSTDLDRLAADLRRVCQWHVELFDGPGAAAPFDRYLFQIAAVGDGYGGLEHRSSTSLICRREELPAPGMDAVNDDYVTLLGLASHEYFHSWNVKRIKPAAFTPYDLARESYTRLLWAFEGITSYYDDLALVRSGVIEPARYLELLGRTVSTVLRNPGRQRQSIAESSFDAWIKYYRQDENTPNAVVSYYAKGSLVALALDLLLRRECRASLDDVMRALWRHYGRVGVGVPEDGIERIAAEVAGHRLDDFFSRYVQGTEDPPLDAWLSEFGVKYELRTAQSATDRGGKPAGGPLPRSALNAKVGADMKLLAVYSGGAAERAGLAAGDQLVAIDGLKAGVETLRVMLERGEPGQSVRLHAFRRDELNEHAVELAPPPLDTCFLVLQESPGDEAAARRKLWLGA